MKVFKPQAAGAAALLTIAPALLIALHPHPALACLPLLLSLWVVRRGCSWGAFALLGGASATAAMGYSEILPGAALLAAGAALLTCAAVAPILWRFDKVATTIAMTVAVLLGSVAGSLLSPRDLHRPPPAAIALQPQHECAAPRLADRVGVYRESGGTERLLILNAAGHASLRGPASTELGFFQAACDGEHIQVELPGQLLMLRPSGLRLLAAGATIFYPVEDTVSSKGAQH